MNYIDLFAGSGGLSLGLKKAGLKGLFAVEKNKDAFNTLKYNLIERNEHFDWPSWLKMTNWDINELLKNHYQELLELRGDVDLIVGGPPCQGFSMAGKRKTNDNRNQLMHSYIKMVDIIQPNMLFFENVQGFTIDFQEKNHKKNYSSLLVEHLETLGYSVTYQIVTMSDFGVPQRRKRFILFASKNKAVSENFFELLYGNIEEFLKQKNIQLPIAIVDAIGDLTKEQGQTDSPDTKKFMSGLYGEISSSYQRLMRENITKGEIPDSHRFANHRVDTIVLFQELMMVSEKSFRITPSMNLVKGLKKRGITPLKQNSICSTITSIPDDYIHYSEPRIMTVREHARIQSFPDDYHFKGPYTTGGARRRRDVPRYTQVANAVPPLFAEQVGRVVMTVRH